MPSIPRGVSRFAKDLQARVEAICQQIISTPEPYHYVMMQEVWDYENYNKIAYKVHNKL